MMTDYQWCKFAYERDWATKDQLQIWVRAKKITPEEYKDITGDEYKPKLV